MYILHQLSRHWLCCHRPVYIGMVNIQQDLHIYVQVLLNIHSTSIKLDTSLCVFSCTSSSILHIKWCLLCMIDQMIYQKEILALWLSLYKKTNVFCLHKSSSFGFSDTIQPSHKLSRTRPCCCKQPERYKLSELNIL